MQRGQPTGRGSNERNSEYERGYAAGFEAGQRANREQGAYQQPNNRMQGQPMSSGFGGNRRSQSRDYEGNNPNRPTDYTNGFQSRRSLDNPVNTRNNPPQNREHEMAGKVTNPDNRVQYNARGQY